MFIGIIGTQCSGKHSVAEYLVEKHAFQMLYICGSAQLDRVARQGAKAFLTIDEMHNYVTERWRENFVTCDVDGHNVDLLTKRPFFLLVSVQAPLSMRYHRYIKRSKALGLPDIGIEKFIVNDDLAMYNSAANTSTPSNEVPLHHYISLAEVTVTNMFEQKSDFFASLDDADLTNSDRLRPSWDSYFMQLSDLAARRSNCMKRRVGCILVKDSHIIATGYNGTPRGLRNCNEGGCGRCNANAPCGTGLDRCLCMHAEENALLEAGRGRVNLGVGVVLYCNTCPCLGCAIKIVQIGVKEVVYSKSYGMDAMTAQVFAQANVKLRQHSPPSIRPEADAAVVDKAVRELSVQ
ncbi:cytidine deaminase-like protein [Fennellomyces sp. T-0311]|nr:cytidine deaminase-like protein [Fennellomyces sp. T-0311]